LFTDFVQMAPVAVAPYLQAYGFAALDPSSWRVPPGSAGATPSSGSRAVPPAPKLVLQMEGHKEVDGHTLYSLVCSLADETVCINWCAQRRLQQLREDLHDAIKGELGEAYHRHFGRAPFAHKGGLPGTTARLQSWVSTLAACVNAGHAPPSVVALVLSFFEAPEWKLDVSDQRSPACSGLQREGSLLACMGVGAWEARGADERAGLDDIEVSLAGIDDDVLRLQLPHRGGAHRPPAQVEPLELDDLVLSDTIEH